MARRVGAGAGGGFARTLARPGPHTGPGGYKYTANRVGNNGPMDDTTRKIVKFVAEFDESKLTEPVVRAINRTMVDSMAALVAGFEEKPVRIAARVARHATPGELKSTVLGYGVTTTPELAAFANGVLVRETDLNDATSHEQPHSRRSRDRRGAALDRRPGHGRDRHRLRSQSRARAGESVAPAMAAGKLMGLDEDRLANALTIALTPHVALNKGVGALSMWKGVRSAEATKCGIWAAILAREGMTGPPQPFEGRGGLWSRNGRGREFTMPVRRDQMAIERNWFKRRPSEASSQGPLQLIPEMRAWTKPDEIASIQYDMNDLGEISDAPKWDPPNRETADHSMPYMLARAMIDGDIWLDSFTEAKFMDPVARALMDKMTFGQVQAGGTPSGT